MTAQSAGNQPAYQTFPSLNNVRVVADAFISTRPMAAGEHPHAIVVKDRDQRPVVALYMTLAAVRDLRDLLTTIVGDTPDPDEDDDAAAVRSWADRDLTRLALNAAVNS